MIPKSLHTVSVLVNVARELILVRKDAGLPVPNSTQAVDAAAVILGYGDAADDYGLKAKAVRVLSA
jgi:hypothetical protein